LKTRAARRPWHYAKVPQVSLQHGEDCPSCIAEPPAGSLPYPFSLGLTTESNLERARQESRHGQRKLEGVTSASLLMGASIIPFEGVKGSALVRKNGASRKGRPTRGGLRLPAYDSVCSGLTNRAMHALTRL
jgi:hypothetical protein